MRAVVMNTCSMTGIEIGIGGSCDQSAGIRHRYATAEPKAEVFRPCRKLAFAGVPVQCTCDGLCPQYRIQTGARGCGSKPAAWFDSHIEKLAWT